AIPSENALNLWLTNWDFKVRSSHGWVADVVTHEFSHLVSIESGAKFNPHLYGIQFSYSDYYNERTTTDFISMIPFSLQPLWLAEGTAQYESSRMGFDGWDTHRDMLLRTAALNDSLLPLEYMHDFSDNSLLAELGPYNQGFSLVLYISKHYGEDALPKIWNNLASYQRVTLDGALKKVLGISEKELYEKWKKETIEKYRAQKDSLGERVEGSKITTDAFWQDFPVIAGDYVYGVSNFGGPWFDGGLFKMPLTLDSLDDKGQKIKEEKKESGEPFIESFEGTINIGDYAKHGFKTKKPWFDKGIDVYLDSTQGPILAYISYQNRDKDGHAHFDIALSDTNKNQISLTYLADAVYPAFDRQGTSVAFVRREPFSTRFALSKVAMPRDLKSYTAEDPTDIFVPDSTLNYYNIYSPKFSPDGKKIAFGFFDNVVRGIAVIDSDGKNFKVVSDSRYDERDVNWLDDNKIVFSSNRNGIFNLIEKDLSTMAEHPLTNVLGGAFTPVLAKDTLFYTNYDKDGFSLYKLAYSHFVPAKSDTTYKVTSRDSTLHIKDTTWTTCPEVQDPAADTAAATDCKPEAIVTTRDSMIKVLDSAMTVQTQEGSKEIVLKGSLDRQGPKPIELNDIEFGGIEQNYRPIPNVPLFVPMLVLSENAPDLTVFGEGQLKVKAGLGMMLSDPLKKNVLQLGLLLELGSGFDYINSSGLNPKQEKEFFASLENHSTPIDLSISYSYANYTSKDTVRYEDVKAHGGDSLGINHYAIPMQAISAAAGYSIFKSIDTLQVAVGYDWADFNLYEDNFSWTYQKKITATTLFALYGDQSEDGPSIDGQGNGAIFYYQYSNSDLYRPGTFAESFTVTESGTIKPNYRNFNINEVGVHLYGSVQSPWTGARLAAGGKISGIVKWDTDAKEDTLDSYYYSPVFLEGYPYLRSNESYTLAGTKNAVAEIHYLFPIYDDWRKNWWIFDTRSFYIDVFAQMGAAWNTKWFDTDKLTDHRFWDRSVGISLRMSNKLFSNVPLDMTFTLARGLSRIGEDSDLHGGHKLTPIDIPLLSKNIAPTRIKFTLGMNFVNSWQ
ncbi:MAG: PD40 domain-containing protein, partial [Fibrobacter sp.]|nr:PD40 domain-containing protein [Fibrobacter sp.]